jgi:hypothetical protein
MSFEQAESASRSEANDENLDHRVGSGRIVAGRTSPDNSTTMPLHDGCVVRLVGTSMIDLCSEPKLSTGNVVPKLPSNG